MVIEWQVGVPNVFRLTDLTNAHYQSFRIRCIDDHCVAFAHSISAFCLPQKTGYLAASARILAFIYDLLCALIPEITN
ncbi:hypothetical protein ACOZ32_05550 [Halobacterium sp. MBLA0001]|uniref:hypothetical protein n=1 Tax=Halobacterium sp. MBLA0001 TaxID=3413511 RepID=UPI003C7605D5